MLDASILQAPTQSLKMEEKALIGEDAMSADWTPTKRHHKDTDERWPKKHGKSYFA
jgi:hypothetical protein